MFLIRLLLMIFSFAVLNAQSLNELKKAKQLLESGLIDGGTINDDIQRKIDKNQIENKLKDLESLESDNSIEQKQKNELIEAYNADIDNSVNKINTIQEENDITSFTSENEDFENSNEETEVEFVKEKIISTNQPALNYFGYNVFQANPEIFQNSLVESADPDYILGPGDEIIIMLWGETEFNESYIISKDGYLFITNVGQVFVNGLTLVKLEKKLFRLLKKAYASLDPVSGDAKTFFDVSLGGLVLRPLKVFVLGSIAQPGAYILKPSTSLFTSLFYFNGPNVNGSLRDIRLIRNQKEIAKIDFYDYLLSGKQVNDTRLNKDDVIFVPQRGRTVEVKGEINNPAIYELKDDEGLKDLISILGGLKNTTYTKRIQIDRILSVEERIKEGIDRTLIDVSLDEVLSAKDGFKLFDGDIVQFFKISDQRSNTVTINGAINRPGVYALNKGLFLKDLIKKADGLLGDAYLKRVDIVRNNNDFTQTQIDVSLEGVLNGDPEHNILLSSNDVISIYQDSEMKYKTDVTIRGHVINPGPKPFRKGMQVYDLVFMGGGFENEIHFKNTFLDRADLIRWDKDSLAQSVISFRLDSVLVNKGIAQSEIKMGDEIVIYSKGEILGIPNRTVTVSGNVKRPGEYVHYDNLKISDLLFMAGGIEDEVFLSSIYMERADLIRLSDDFITKSITPFSLYGILDTNNTENNFTLKPDDEIRVYAKYLFNKIKSVSISGAVNKPGEYEVKNGMNIKDLILEAGGITQNVFSYRVEVARLDQYNDNEQKLSEIITMEMKNDYTLFRFGESTEFQIKPYDYISIRPDPNFQMHKKVVIEGFVQYPGEYILENPKENVYDIIRRAGGLKEDAYPSSSILVRNNEQINIDFQKILRNPFSKYNFILTDGDKITINNRPHLIKINGAVNTPGNYQFIKGTRLNEYIKLAGGYSENASKWATFVQYPNGTSKKISFLQIISPIVLDGSTITIPQKEEVEPFNFTEYVTNITSIWADITQAYLLITIAAGQTN